MGLVLRDPHPKKTLTVGNPGQRVTLQWGPQASAMFCREGTGLRGRSSEHSQQGILSLTRIE